MPKTGTVRRAVTSEEVAAAGAGQLAGALARKLIPDKKIASGGRALMNGLRALKANAESKGRTLSRGLKEGKIAVTDRVVRAREYLDEREQKQLNAKQQKIDEKKEKLGVKKTGRAEVREADENSKRKALDYHEQQKTKVVDENQRRQTAADSRKRAADDERAAKLQEKMNKEDAELYRNRKDAAALRGEKAPVVNRRTKFNEKASARRAVIAADRKKNVGSGGIHGNTVVLHTRSTAPQPGMAWPPVQKMIDNFYNAAQLMKTEIQKEQKTEISSSHQAHPFISAMTDVHNQEIIVTDLIIAAATAAIKNKALLQLKDKLEAAVAFFDKYMSGSNAWRIPVTTTTIPNVKGTWVEPLRQYIAYVQGQNRQATPHVSGTKEGFAHRMSTHGGYSNTANALMLMQTVLNAW